MAPTTPTTQPLGARVAQMVQSLQFLWFSAHAFLLLLSFRCAFYYIRFSSSTLSAIFLYRLAFASAVVAYGVVVYRAHFSKRLPSLDSLPRMRSDENVAYLIMAIFYLYAKPLFPLLVPYAIYSLFHVLSYARTNLFPTLAPQSSLIGNIGDAVGRFYDPAMSAVAAIEILAISPRLTVGALLRLNSGILAVCYLGFLRVRWEQSLFVRRIFGRITMRIDALAAGGNVPGGVRNAWVSLKTMLAGPAMPANGSTASPAPKSTTGPKKSN